jgi:hypothetical protein
LWQLAVVSVDSWGTLATLGIRMRVSLSILVVGILGLLVGCAAPAPLPPGPLSAAMSDAQILQGLRLDPRIMKGKVEHFMDSSRALYTDGVNEVLIVRSIGEVDVTRMRPVESQQNWHLQVL